MTAFLLLWLLALVVVTIIAGTPKANPVEPELKFEPARRGPWAYFADEITPRKFEAKK